MDQGQQLRFGPRGCQLVDQKTNSDRTDHSPDRPTTPRCNLRSGRWCIPGLGLTYDLHEGTGVATGSGLSSDSDSPAAAWAGRVLLSPSPFQVRARGAGT